MSKPAPSGSSHSTILDGGKAWWLDPGLARLAFGSRSPRRAALAVGAPSHLAFLAPESLEIDLEDPRQRDFGDYELLELIGQGGMGVVYRARQACLDREVAVKLLSAGPWASSEFVERFQHEAQAAARMQHPNIVAIYETGVHEDLNFFSMRLVHGGSLAHLLAKRGKLAPVEAARLLRTVAEAVDYAHRMDVLHLDLKPGNVLIDENGEPQVADFGLARRFDEVLALDNNEVSGTPSYMSPEQAQARTQQLSPATDIYGLGAILYECLTGRPPFHAASPQETLMRVVTVAPESPRALDAAIPVDLEAICLKCLAKDPAARYGSARALADDLTRFLDGREVAARPLHSGQRVLQLARREPKLAALVALLFFSLVFGFGATSVQWQRAERNAAESNALLWDSRRDAALRLQRDGKGFDAVPKLLANIRDQEAAGQSALAALERRRVGMLLGQGAVLIDQMVIADASPLAVDVSPDGSLLAVALSDQTVRWYDSATLTERGRVSLRGRVDALGQPGVPRLLRFFDRHRLRVTLDWLSNQASPDDGDTWLVDLDRKTLVKPPAAFADFADATYSDDGRFALLRNHDRRSQLWQVAPWRPRSALGPGTDRFTPWLLGPDDRYAAFLGEAMVKLAVHRLPGLSRPQQIDVPGRAGVSAWSRSRDGRWLALGDFEGRAFLLELATGKLRLLPTPHGREVTWTAFSEDDAWLAVATRDGTAYAFDVASGNPLIAGQMQQDFPLERVGISHRHRLLVAAGKGEAALWRLPQQGPRAVPAQRIGANPLRHESAEDYAIGWSLQTGLLATAGLDGQVRLWRLPLGPTAPARAARQVPERTWFDGRRLVDVEWDQLRLVDPGGKALTRWLKLPQPPGFAELLAGSDRLLVSTGPQLRLYDSSSLRLRYPPIALDASPERLLASSDGSNVAVTFSATGPGGFSERLQIFDLRTGRRRPGEALLLAPLRHLAFSPDGSRLLAVGPATGATSVLAAKDLHLIGDFPHDQAQPVVWAEFASSGSTVLLVTRASDLRLGSDLVIDWDPRADQVREQHETGAARPLGVIATGGGRFVAGSNQDLLDPGGAQARLLPRLARSESTAILAVSPDQRLVAHAFLGEVQIHEAANGANLGPPLQGDGDANDVIVQLAFASDGSRLLARTVQGFWRTWPIAADTRPVAAIARQLASMTAAGQGRPVATLPSAAERLAMRGRDSGAWPNPQSRPEPSSRERLGVRIPLRAPATADLLIDLSDVYNFSPDAVRNVFWNVRSRMRPIPAGVQRVAGTDYDLRGLVQIGTIHNVFRRGEWGGSRRLVECAAVPPVPIAALHLLLQISTPTPFPDQQTLATLRLHYRDGSQALLPIRTQREVPGYAGRDQDVAMALAIDAAWPARGLMDPGVSRPRLVNPFPERIIRCVDLASTGLLNPLLLFAITAEPVPRAAAGPTPGPVTSHVVLRTSVRGDSTIRVPDGLSQSPIP